MLAYIPYMDPMGFAENELVNGVFSTNVHITGPQKRQPFWSPHHQDETPRIDWNSLVSLLVSLASSASKQIGSKIIQDPCLEIELYWTCSIIQFVCRLTQTQIGNKHIGYKIDQKCICLEVTIWMIKVHISLFCTKQFLNSQSQPFRCSNAAVEAWRRLQTVEKSLGRNLFLQGCLLQNVIQCVLQSKLIVFLGQWRHITREKSYCEKDGIEDWPCFKISKQERGML